MNFREMTKEQLAEESLIDLTFAILDDKKSTITFEDLLNVLQQLNGASDEYMQEQFLQFYTDMNIDGRFLLNQEGQWGLREWYKVEQIEEETAPIVKTRKKKAKVVADDLEEIEVDEDDLVFEEDYEEFVSDDEEDDDEEEDVLDFDAVVDEDDLVTIEEDIEEVIEIEDEEFELEEELDEEDDLAVVEEDDLK
ncbi:MAG: DNA-directed RNA polymerase subunit delta [Caryophanon sp.]|nr:DNA-directed RNA polymerase subunit delta [Caryophanon sp.]